MIFFFMSFYGVGSQSIETKVKSLRNTMQELFHSRLLVNRGEKDADDLVGQKGFSFLEGRANLIRQSLSSLIAFFKQDI